MLLLGYSLADPARARVLRRYATEWRHAPDPVGGADLRRIGLQGPPVGKLLRAARRRAGASAQGPRYDLFVAPKGGTEWANTGNSTNDPQLTFTYTSRDW